MNRDDELKPDESVEEKPSDTSENRTDDAPDTPDAKPDGNGGGAAYHIKKFGKAAWDYIKHAKIELLVLVGLLAVDLITKALVDKYMYLYQQITIIPKLLHFTYYRNTRAAFGSAFGLEKLIGDDAIRIIFLVITVIAVGVFCYLMYRCRRRHILMRLALALIVGGALGNFIDRLVLHYVRDFIEIEYLGCTIFGDTSFAIFNVADMGLTVGVVLFLIYFIAIYKEPKKVAPQETDAPEGGADSAEPDGQNATQSGDDVDKADDCALQSQSDAPQKEKVDEVSGDETTDNENSDAEQNSESGDNE